MAKTYRNPADLDAAACPGWPRSSRSSIRVDGNGHPLELKRNLLRRHDVWRSDPLCLRRDGRSLAKKPKNVEDQLADKWDEQVSDQRDYCS